MYRQNRVFFPGRDHMATKQEDGVNHHHTVKCVIVGDGGVGKSLLVSARATSKKYELKDLFKTHISSVWAVDHYRTNLEVGYVDRFDIFEIKRL